MQMFYQAQAKIADGDKTFMFDILPTITWEEFKALTKKRPQVYEKYRELVKNHLRRSK